MNRFQYLALHFPVSSSIVFVFLFVVLIAFLMCGCPPVPNSTTSSTYVVTQYSGGQVVGQWRSSKHVIHITGKAAFYDMEGRYVSVCGNVSIVEEKP